MVLEESKATLLSLFSVDLFSSAKAVVPAIAKAEIAKQRRADFSQITPLIETNLFECINN